MFTSLPKYDVFLSFRGEDTRHNFISFLYKELVERNIQTFKDDVELESGGRIASGLRHGIKESRIAVVVVSVNYPSSPWCLDELVMIMDLVKEGFLTVIPIFYGVIPAHLRRQIGAVGEQFKKHEGRVDPERVRSWRQALFSLASISGHCSGEKDDSKLVDEVAESISNKLCSETPCNDINLVGIDKHMEALDPLLDLDSSEDERLVGIWGRGSMERLALASHVYEKIKHNFDAHCFLDNFRKISLFHYRNITHLQEELLSKMKGECLSSETSPNAIKARLGNKKVLLVANDVDKLEELDALAAEANRLFGPGSRIIITTQDRQLLNSSVVKWVYEFEQLKCYKSLPLFRSVALKRKDHVCSEQSTYRVMSFSGNIFLGL